MNIRFPFLIHALIILFCLVTSRELLHAWSQAPYEYFSWVILLIWCFPVLFYWIISAPKFHKPLFSNIPLWIAVCASLLGILGDLNTLNYIGLAFAISSLIPWNWISWLWIASSAAWMPALGWFGSHYFHGYVFGLRLLLAVLGATAMIFAFLYSNKSGDPCV